MLGNRTILNSNILKSVNYVEIRTDSFLLDEKFVIKTVILRLQI